MSASDFCILSGVAYLKASNQRFEGKERFYEAWLLVDLTISSNLDPFVDETSIDLAHVGEIANWKGKKERKSA